MKISIIGSNGFIGKYLTSTLSKNQDVELVNVDLAPQQNFIGKPSEKCSYFCGSFTDKSLMQKVLGGVDCIYFLPSATYPSLSWNQPKLDITDNLIPFLDFLDSCIELKVKKVVLSSSGGTVYGDAFGELTEDHAALPYSPYGIIKNTMENYLRFYKKKYNLKFDVYRLTNPYGPYQENYKQGFGVIYIWLQKIANNLPIEIYGSGKDCRDFVYVEDAAELMKKSINNLETSDLYNLSYGESVSLIELAAIIEKVIERKLNIHFLESRAHDNKRVQLNSKKLLSAFPHFSYTSLEAGILKTWQEIVSSKNIRTD